MLEDYPFINLDYRGDLSKFCVLQTTVFVIYILMSVRRQKSDINDPEYIGTAIAAVVVQLLSRVLLFATPWTTAHQTSLHFTVFQSLLKLMSVESVMPSNYLILHHPLLFLPSLLPSIMVFSSKLALPIRWPKYWSFSFSISPFNEYSGLISFRIDWFDLLAVQGTLKSLLQHHGSKV